MKKQILSLLAVLLLIGLVSCGETKKEEPVAEETTPTIEQTEPAEVAETEVTDESAEVAETPAETKAKEKTATSAVEDKPQPVKGPLVGKVINIQKLLTSKDASVTSQEAKSLIGKGKLLAFQENTTNIVYIVVSAGGSYAGKKLAQLAGSDIQIEGKKKVIMGTNIIIADKISAM